MNLLTRLEANFTALDSVALLLLVLCWFVTGWLAEHPPAWRPAVAWRIVGPRRRWMPEFLTRQPHIFDAAVIDTLRQSRMMFARNIILLWIPDGRGIGVENR